MKITTYPFTASAAQEDFQLNWLEQKDTQAVLTGQKRQIQMIAHLNYDFIIIYLTFYLLILGNK